LNQHKTYFKSKLQQLYSDDELNIIFKLIVESLIKKNQELDFLLFLEDYIEKLARNMPIQYVLEEAYFYGLIFNVNQHVLIPRPETEELVDLVVKQYINQKVKILDIGTGSGCIPISLKHKLPYADITAIDISESALVLAKQNADINRVEVNFILDNALNLESEKYSNFDVIVSNPPYIALSEKENMDINVTAFEPDLALFVPDENPLIFYDKIADFALSNLRKFGTLYFEINQNLALETKKMLQEKGFKVELIKDINQNYRITKAQLLG
jgi:release factor glutamine methyltransferase